MKKSFLFLLVAVLTLQVSAQFDAEVGTQGCKAISYHDNRFVSWAKGVEINRGTQSYGGQSLVTFGKHYNAIGPDYDSTVFDCVSLGHGGSALITFDRPIINGEGFDFAVFENGFGRNDGNANKTSFFELAFVEVSSDGEHFFRFPTTSLATEDSISEAMIDGFAGKYIIGFGVGFDLDDLPDNEFLDKNNVRLVKLVDVERGVDMDSQGNLIWDGNDQGTYSAGFDLSLVGVINGGRPYKIADMENYLTAENSYEIVNEETNYDMSGDITYRNYTFGGLVFPSVGYESAGYGMQIGWGMSNINDGENIAPTSISSQGWNALSYASSVFSGLESENSSYLNAYYADYDGTPEHLVVYAENNSEFYPQGVYLSHSAVSYNYAQHNVTDVDWHKVVATGYDAQGNITSSNELYLTDYRSSEGTPALGNRNDWRWLDLTKLGRVSKVKFSLETSYTGTYGMEIDAYFCMDNFVYQVEDFASAADIQKDNDNVNVVMYPNPAKDFVKIYADDIKSVEVFDQSGRLVIKELAYNGNTTEGGIIMNVSGLRSGMYFVKVNTSKSQITEKLIVK